MYLLAQDASNSLASFLPLVLIGAFFWFVMIRPQRKRAAERKDMIGALAVGSAVVTIGGIHGVVDALGEDWVDLLVTEDVVIRVTREAIGQVVPVGGDDDPDDIDELDARLDDEVDWPSGDDQA